MNGERHVDVYDAGPEVLDLVNETQISGNRIVFERNQKAVALLVSYDEYVALRETTALCGRPESSARIAAGRDAIRRGQVDEERSGENLWFSASSLEGLGETERREALEIATALAEDPISGVPLFEPFTGLWCRVAENLRIFYEISPQGAQIGILFVERAGN